MFKYLKNNKILSIMILLTLISILIGIFFYVYIKKDYYEIISKNIFLLFNNKKINYKKVYINNYINLFIIWLLGISILGIILVLFLYLFKIFTLSFEITSMISILKGKNIIKISLYLLKGTIISSVYFFICYYAILYSLYLIKHLFINKHYDMHYITKKYIVILLFSIIIIFFVSLIEIIILKKL